MLNEETPVFVATFQTQEIFCFRNAITKEIGAGSPNEVVGVNYAVVIGRVEDELDDEITGGWKVLEVSLTDLVSRRQVGTGKLTGRVFYLTLTPPSDCPPWSRHVELFRDFVATIKRNALPPLITRLGSARQAVAARSRPGPSWKGSSPRVTRRVGKTATFSPPPMELTTTRFPPLRSLTTTTTTTPSLQVNPVSLLTRRVR